MRIRFPRLTLPASLLLSLASGCWMDEFDGEDDAAELPPQQPLPLEGSPTAYGMLRVVNELGFSELDGEVGLDRQAAKSILAHRLGPDARSGTPDDRYVEYLAELDELYWLGEANLWQIQAHALSQGWVPGSLAEGCEPALAEVLTECRTFVLEGFAGSSAAAEAVSWRCVEAGEDAQASAAGYFASAGLPAYLDPALGYHAMLCDGAAASAPICELGVAGLATHALPECVIDAG